jgi:hypothetical protein
MVIDVDGTTLIAGRMGSVRHRDAPTSTAGCSFELPR